MAYRKVGWKDFPDTSTPTNATNLNHMDDQIAANAEALDNAVYYEEDSTTVEYINLVADQADKDGAGNNIAEQFRQVNNTLTGLQNKQKWKLIGKASGTNSVTFDSSKYEELMILSGTPYYRFTDIVPTMALTDIGYNLSHAYNSINSISQSVRFGISKTSASIASAYQNSADNTANGTIEVYGR